MALQDVALWLFVTRDEADAWAGPRIIPKISQETLAEISGTTRPRVIALVNKFRELGFIGYNGRLIVHSGLLSVVLRD